MLGSMATVQRQAEDAKEGHTFTTRTSNITLNVTLTGAPHACAKDVSSTVLVANEANPQSLCLLQVR